MTHLIGKAALDDGVTLVELQTNGAVDGALTGGNGGSDELAFGAEEVTVVKNVAELDGDELITERADVTVECKTLKIHVCDTKDGSSGRLVATTRLDTDEAILDDIDTSDAVLAGKRVEDEEDLDLVGVLLAASMDLDGETALELDGDLLSLSGSIFLRRRQLPHVLGRGGVRVLKDTSLV
jgi:hypothetical protein